MLCAVGAVTNRIPYCRTRVFLRIPLSFHPHSAHTLRTHALRVMLRPARLSCILRTTRTHQDARFSLLVASFLLPSYVRTLNLLSLVQPLPTYRYESYRHECLRIRGLHKIVPLPFNGRLCNHHRKSLAVSLF